MFWAYAQMVIQRGLSTPRRQRVRSTIRRSEQAGFTCSLRTVFLVSYCFLLSATLVEGTDFASITYSSGSLQFGQSCTISNSVTVCVAADGARTQTVTTSPIAVQSGGSAAPAATTTSAPAPTSTTSGVLTTMKTISSSIGPSQTSGDAPPASKTNDSPRIFVPYTAAIFGVGSLWFLL
jgi:hypothetical protein